MSEDSTTQNGFVQLTDSTLMREIDAQTILLDIESEVYFSLDDVGTDVLSTVLEAADIDAAIAVLLELYEVDADTLRADVFTLLRKLKDAELITGQW